MTTRTVRPEPVDPAETLEQLIARVILGGGFEASMRSCASGYLQYTLALGKHDPERAAEFCQLPVREFLRLCREHGIPTEREQ